MNQTEEKTDYNRYHYTWVEIVRYSARYLVLSAAAAWVFYQSIWGMVLAAGVLPAGLHRKKKECMKQRKRDLMYQFKDCIRFVSGALSAGYSMEHAWEEAGKDMVRMYGTEADMCKELVWLNRSIRLQQPIEQGLLDFAARSGLEDVRDFCQIFSFAKRSGGDFVKIIANTGKRISDKNEILQEIETVLAEKKLEQKIMNLVPFFILIYIQIFSPEFLSTLYGNLPGVLMMSICLICYVIAVLISEKIVDIDV